MFQEYSELSKMSWESEFTGEEMGYNVETVNHYTYGNLNMYIDNANDSSQEQDILAYIVYKHISSLETKIKQELDKLDFKNKYIREAKEKVQQQFDNKNKFKGEFGFKGENLYVTASGVKYATTTLKPEVLVTPDGIEFKSESLTKPIPLEKVLLGSLTLQEKDGKLAITYADGSTRYIK